MRYLFLLLCILSKSILFGQIEGLSLGQIVTNNITEVNAYLDMSSDDPLYENLKVKTFKFDDKGRCVYKKYIYPFYDVVGTSEEYFIKYNNRGNITEKIWIRKTVGISKQGIDYIAMFGETNDTTVTEYYFTSDVLNKELEYKKGKGDTLITIYEYQDSLLIHSNHFSTKNIAKIHKENFSKRYYYDDQGRLERIDESPEGVNGYSINRIKYIGNSELIYEDLTFNKFRWLRTFKNGESSLSVSQDSLAGQRIVFLYDKKNNLIKETNYRSLDNFNENYYGREYQYRDNLLVEEQVFNKSSDVINLTDKIVYSYNKDRVLIEERMIYNDKWSYSYMYKYGKD